jgi:hypothetical protein
MKMLFKAPDNSSMFNGKNVDGFVEIWPLEIFACKNLKGCLISK